MKEVEEKLAKSLSAETTDLIPYLPYLLQDLWELGSIPEDIIHLIKKNVQTSKDLRILDLACGKGAVCVKLAKEFKCSVKGIDIIPDFIHYAKKKATEYGVQGLCSFKVEDVNISVTKECGYDIVIAVREVLGTPYLAIEKLTKVVKSGGLIILDDAYSKKNIQSEYLSYKQWLKIFEQTGIQLIEEKYVNEAEMSYINERNNECIIRRASELKKKYPDKVKIFDGYINSQLTECEELENDISAVTWMLRKV